LDADLASSQPRVHWLALQSKHAEHAFMHAAQRLAADKPLQAFDAERELPEGE
jgi:hypothetical protein